MSTPGGQQDPYDPNRGAQDMYAPEENIPRQPHYEDSGQQDQRYIPPQQGIAGGQRSGYYRPGGGPYAAPGRPTYLQGAPVDFAEAVRGAFNHIFTFRGRASRSAFWWFALLGAIVYAVASFISDRTWVAGVIVDIVVVLPMWIAGLTLSVRRLHDSDKSGWWWWIGIVPVVGWIVLLVFYLMPGTPGPNRFNRAI
jgi:uncharacterized membrane protein YhaH (DUF805 family)